MQEIALADLDLAEIIRPGDVVLWGQGAGEPTAIVEQLLSQRHRIGPISLFLGGPQSGLLKPEHADTISFFGPGAVGDSRRLIKAGVMRLLPCHQSDLPKLFAEGLIRVDVVIQQLSQDADTGSLSVGAVNSYTQAAAQRARAVLGEINEQAPWTYAREPVAAERFDWLVRTSRPLVEMPPRSFADVERLIAKRIAEFIPDRAVLQVGIGSIPEAVLAALNAHRDLGLHSAVLGDGVVELIESGALTNAHKPIDAGKSVTGTLAGTRRTYAFAHRNPAILVEPVSYTHDITVLARLDRLMAVNGALEVDLTGQIASEVAGSTYLGTVGGQVDFARGAFAARGGRTIIGLPSRTEKGNSRIVARITSGVVTTPRADADVIVTEFGAAELRGQTISERVRRMIAIAHPEDQEGLARAAREAVAGL